MAKTQAQHAEGLDALFTAHGNLVKFGEQGLIAAYTFGNVIEALHRFYTYREMAAALGYKSVSTINKYSLLYRKYPNENTLLREASRLETYDVQRLNGSTPAIPLVYVFHCQNCGSYDVHKERETPEIAAALETARLARLAEKKEKVSS